MLSIKETWNKAKDAIAQIVDELADMPKWRELSSANLPKQASTIVAKFPVATRT